MECWNREKLPEPREQKRTKNQEKLSNIVDGDQREPLLFSTSFKYSETVSSGPPSVPFQENLTAKLDQLVSSHSIIDMGIARSFTLVNEHTAAA